MSGNASLSLWLVCWTLIVTGTGALAAESDADTPEPDQAYLLTLQILGGLASCGDRFGGPEYYATASRDDPVAEKELNAVRGEQDKLRPRIQEFDERIEPLELREHNTVPLTVDELRELEELRARSVVIEQQLEDSTLEQPSEEWQSLTSELSEVKKSVERLENAIPLSDDEVRYLHDQRDQRAPLAERQEVLRTRAQELRDLTYMSTPGSLTVYPNDALALRLMEDDAFRDDTCATWDITLSPVDPAARLARTGSVRSHTAAAVGATGVAIARIPSRRIGQS